LGAEHVTQERVTILDEALGDDIAELGDETLIHEHLVKLLFFCIDEETSDGLVEIIEYFFEVSI